VNDSWLSIIALQAGLTSADVLPQSEVFVNIKYIPAEAGFSHYAKIKVISLFFLINVLSSLNSIHVLVFFYFVSGV